MAFAKTLKGAKVGHFKGTEDCEGTPMPIPKEVFISMTQSMGPPCQPKVQVGDTVKVGTLIGDNPAPMGVPVHASVSGTVKEIQDARTAQGTKTKYVVIEADGKQTLDEAIEVPQVGTHEEFIAAIRKSGLVGLGGAAFPTHIKLNPPPGKVDTLIVNAAECEPFITSDYRTIMDDTQNVLDGIAAIRNYLGLSSVKIVLENNKPKAAELLERIYKEDQAVQVCLLDSVYPKGAEKVAIYESTGRIVQEGQLPHDAGVLVCNVTTVAFIGKYLKDGVPFVSRRLTVDGAAIANPQNVIAPIGTRYSDIIDFCGGYKKDPAKLLMGGPMMGISVESDCLPLLKNNNALLAFDREQAAKAQTTSCIRCGRCMQICPFSLMPRQMEIAYQNDNAGALIDLKVHLCMECGCCSYICPANRDLAYTNHVAKDMARKEMNKRKRRAGK